VLAVAASHSSEIIAMSDVAVMIVSLSSTEHQAENALLDLMRSTRGTKLWAHTRYFVRSARALGLLMFEDVPGKPDQFSHPELPAIAPDAERVSDDTRVGDEDDETSPTSDGPPTTE
jgi:hypothetical protein